MDDSPSTQGATYGLAAIFPLHVGGVGASRLQVISPVNFLGSRLRSGIASRSPTPQLRDEDNMKQGIFDDQA